MGTPAKLSNVRAWLRIQQIGRVEVSSQDRRHRVENALSAGGRGWVASESGEQVIRVVFRAPHTIERIRLVFNERAASRTQEFVLTSSSHRGERHREIVRQQFTFSPDGATRQVEEYRVELRDVTRLELRIVPDISRGRALASLEEFRIA